MKSEQFEIEWLIEFYTVIKRTGWSFYCAIKTGEVCLQTFTEFFE